jgi:hypothetical protein
MTRLQRTYSWISGTSAILAITVQSLVFKWLNTKGLLVSTSQIIDLVTASILYILLYKGIILLYETYGWKMIHRNINIEGIWYHEFVSKAKPSYVRRGRSVIKQDFFSIEIKAQNYNIDFDPSTRTLWQSVALDIDDNGCIKLAFRADRAGSGIPDPLWTKDGLMWLQLDPNKKNTATYRIIGDYADCYPSDYRGAVTFMRRPDWADSYDQAMNLIDD